MPRNIQILFVEDDVSNKFILEITFKNSSYNFQIAGNGKEAIKKIINNNFDIVFLDMNLPDMDGFEVARMIRSLEDPFKRNIPIISMSANEPYENEFKSKFLEAGITAYIKKPFTEQEIEEVIFSISNHFQKNNSESDNSEIEIDKVRLMKIAKGDRALIKKMVDILGRQMEESFIKFDSALEIKDWKGIENTAHSLKSSIIFFGMEFLVETMDKIETYALEKKRLDEISDLIVLAKEGLNNSIKELNKTYQ